MFRASATQTLRSLGRLGRCPPAPVASATSVPPCHHHQFSTIPDNTNYDMGAHYTHSAETGYVRHSAYGSIEVPNVRIDQFVWQNMSQWSNHTALVCGETDRELTYSQLRDHCAALAVRLQRAEFALQPGAIVALVLPNCPEFAIAALGAMEAGLTVTTVNPIYTADEIAKQLIASGAKFLIGTVEGADILRQAIAKSGRSIPLACVRSQQSQTIPAGCIDLAQLADPTGVDFSTLRDHDIDPNGVAFLPFSSGTTGLPKGVMLSHNNITANCLQIDAKLPNEHLVLRTAGDSQEVLNDVLPFFHIYGFTVLLASKLALGCKSITLRQFAPDTFLKSLTVHRSTLVHLVPPIVNFLASHPAVEKKHLQFIRSVMSGAAPIGKTDVERFLKKVDRPEVDFLQGYGMTESSPVVMMNVRHNKRYDSSGGVSTGTEAKIVDVNDPHFRGLPANQSGELLVRGPQVMLGYFQNEAATAETLLPDGWLRSGDVAHYDDQGYFYVTDRLKELIKVKGFQVPPAELESILRAHPLVADVAVIGIKHAISGEVPLAFVVRQKGAGGADDAVEKELKEFVAEKVAEFKRIEGGVRFVEEIPKNATGKILRRELKSKYGLE